MTLVVSIPFKDGAVVAGDSRATLFRGQLVMTDSVTKLHVIGGIAILSYALNQFIGGAVRDRLVAEYSDGASLSEIRDGVMRIAQEEYRTATALRDVSGINLQAEFLLAGAEEQWYFSVSTSFKPTRWEGEEFILLGNRYIAAAILNHLWLSDIDKESALTLGALCLSDSARWLTNIGLPLKIGVVDRDGALILSDEDCQKHLEAARDLDWSQVLEC